MRRAADLAHVNAFCIYRRNVQQSWRNESVVNDALRLFERPPPGNGDQIGIAGAGADERHEPLAAHFVAPSTKSANRRRNVAPSIPITVNRLSVDVSPFTSDTAFLGTPSASAITAINASFAF